MKKQRPISIIQVLPNLALTGGTAAKVKLLAEHSSYFQIICYADNPKNDIYIDSWKNITNCSIERGYTMRNPFINAIKLLSVVKRYNVKIVHAYFPIDSVSAYILKMIYPSIKIIRSFEGPINYSRRKRVIQNIVFTKHSFFIYISKYIQSYYEEIFNTTTYKRGKVVYNCPAFFEPLTTPIYHDVKDRILVSVGGLNPFKNTEILVEAIKILVSKGFYVKSYVLGDGNLRELIQFKIDEYELQNNVILCGYKKNVNTYLDRSSIYIHTARLEGFGMAVVEAMSRCCAVIVSDSSALPELVNDGIDGLIAKANDPEDWATKIENLLGSQDTVNRLGEKAYEKVVNKFSIKTYVDNIDSIYNKLL